MIIYSSVCTEDAPVEPDGFDAPKWPEVDFDTAAGESRMVAVDFTGDHGLAVRLVIPDGGAGMELTNEFFSLQPDRGWQKIDLDSIRSGFIAMDIALDNTGEPVLAGIQYTSPHSTVLELRGSLAEYIEKFTHGMLTVDGHDSFMVAGGRSRSGLWTSTGPGDWIFDNRPPTGTNDSGFHDVYVRRDRAVACGYDDGADTEANLIHASPSGGLKEITPFPGGLLQIGQAAGGTIYAVGFRRGESTGTEHGVMPAKNP